MIRRLLILPASLALFGSAQATSESQPGEVSSVEIHQHVETPVIQELYFPPGPDEVINLDIQPENQPFLDVDTRGRAADFEQAFQSLRDSAPEGNIYAIVRGRSIDHISDLRVMQAGTLIMLTTSHRSGEDQHIVKVEDMERLGLRGRSRKESPVKFPKGWK